MREVKATVVGGGLAGISAALILSEAGVRVRLIERSKRLGGRASSLFNHRLGKEIDFGQHALLGCCTNLLDFYKRIGALEHIDFFDTFAFADGGSLRFLKPSFLPEPFHLFPSMLALRRLSFSDKIKSARLLRGKNHRFETDVAASTWLSSLGQSEQAITGFWQPILTAALNEKLTDASARHASYVIRQAMLGNRAGYPLGISRVHLSKLHDGLAGQALEAQGVEKLLRTTVADVVVDAGKVTGVHTADGSFYDSDYVVVATNPSAAPLASGLKSPSGRVVVSKPIQVPIVTLYCWFRDRVEIPKVLCVSRGEFAWCFDRSESETAMEGFGTAVTMVASAAGELLAKSDEEIQRIGISELGEAMGARLSPPERFSVVRIKNATFSPSIDCDSVRPLQETEIENVFLAGDWTATGWPGTMESAVRSGYICASKILAREGMQASVPLADLPPALLYRLISGTTLKARV